MSPSGNGEKSKKSAAFLYPGQMPPELKDWVPYKTKGLKEKFSEKIKQNPFVPIGCLATACALSYGLVQFRRGQTKKSQMMMRVRVAAQAFTIGAIIIGVFIQAAKGNSSYGATTPEPQSEMKSGANS